MVSYTRGWVLKQILDATTNVWLCKCKFWGDNLVRVILRKSPSCSHRRHRNSCTKYFTINSCVDYSPQPQSSSSLHRLIFLQKSQCVWNYKCDEVYGVMRKNVRFETYRWGEVVTLYPMLVQDIVIVTISPANATAIAQWYGSIRSNWISWAN